MSPNDRGAIVALFGSVVIGSVGVVVYDGVVGGVGSSVVGFMVGVLFDSRLGRIPSIFCAGTGRRLWGWSGRRRKVVVPGGRLVRVAAALMAPQARRRWLEDVEITLHDFAPEQHRALLRDFLVHAPAVIVVGWAAWAGRLPYALAGIRRRPAGPRR
ncbi:hypothetical protein D0T12_28385 [Actinomadura spongiicola]|uniref:Uncharacterized protein n=1 Tax=Actinomadura spongiicola TaxID=2303421 RepID=A0A372G9X5_9ACTN|nr:hypothetical protein [Actinomadura spongiicola]RFS82161.1 hypothetical protein D0T12_28385 [Actinomadura spongiicola]